VRDDKKESPIVCTENCSIGDLGHCGRTEYDYLRHCEKLFYNGKEQRFKQLIKEE